MLLNPAKASVVKAWQKSLSTPWCGNCKEHDNCYEWRVEGHKGWASVNFGCLIDCGFKTLRHVGCGGKGTCNKEPATTEHAFDVLFNQFPPSSTSF